jgi:hypothetical protein
MLFLLGNSSSIKGKTNMPYSTTVSMNVKPDIVKLSEYF